MVGKIITILNAVAIIWTFVKTLLKNPAPKIKNSNNRYREKIDSLAGTF